MSEKRTLRPFLNLALKLVVLLTFLSACMLGLFIVSVYKEAFGKIYTEGELRAFENQYGSTVLSSDGVLLGSFYDVNRTQADFEEIPDHLIEALLATEDVRFFEHEGVDFRSLLRVLFRTILMGDRSGGGGSTITQQLAKNMFGRTDHGFLSIPVNKTREMILAQRMESTFSKREILTKYLNTVSFGEDVYGIKAATKRYFDKSPAELETQEAATLIGMLKATNYYNPRLNPENAINRRNTVLSQMEKYDYLDGVAVDSLQSKPLALDYQRSLDVAGAGYFLRRVRKEAEKILSEKAAEGTSSWSLERDGLIIETTLDAKLQTYALASMQQQLRNMQPMLEAQYSRGRFQQQVDSLIETRYRKFDSGTDSAAMRRVFSWREQEKMTLRDSIRYSLLQLHAGVLAMDPTSGAVLAYVGGVDFATNPFDQVQAKRQLASTFKPVLYAAALSEGKSPCDYVSNEPFTLTDFDNWSPANYNEKTGGKYSLAASLAYSKNIPSVRLLFETGFEPVIQTWKAMGFNAEPDENPALALGAIEASLQELVSGYAAFANGGVQNQPYMIQRISDRQGNVLFERVWDKGKKALPPEVASDISSMLQKAIEDGTGKSLRTRFGIQMPLAGKTGTSQDFADAWFVGYNTELIIATRVGASLPVIHFSTGVAGAGSTLALPIVGNALQLVERDSELSYGENSDFYFDAALLDCPDFEEATGFDKFLKVFKSEKTTLEKEQKKTKKKGFFKRLFGKKKDQG